MRLQLSFLTLNDWSIRCVHAMSVLGMVFSTSAMRLCLSAHLDAGQRLVWMHSDGVNNSFLSTVRSVVWLQLWTLTWQIWLCLFWCHSRVALTQCLELFTCCKILFLSGTCIPPPKKNKTLPALQQKKRPISVMLRPPLLQGERGWCVSGCVVLANSAQCSGRKAGIYTLLSTYEKTNNAHYNSLM